MYDIFRQVIELHRWSNKGLFNARVIDLKQFTTIDNSLVELQKKIDAEEQKTFKYKWKKLWSKK
jgi:hypothetical protein